MSILTPIHAASSVRLSTPVTCFGSRSEANSVAVSIIISPQIILLSSLVLWGVAARQIVLLAGLKRGTPIKLPGCKTDLLGKTPGAKPLAFGRTTP